MKPLLSSKVVTGDEAPKQRSVPVLPTSVALFVGITEWGPVGEATQVSSWAEYVDVFGGYLANSDVPVSVNAFFANGGTNAWIVRVVHYTDVGTPSTKASAAATLTLKDRAATTPVDTLKFDGKYDGTRAHNYKPRIEAPTSGNTDEFNVTIETLTGVRLETFTNLKIGAANAADPKYVETVINDPNNGSKLVVATDLESATASPNNLPALGLAAALASGNDGLTGVADADFVGSSAGKTGIYAGDYVEDLTLLLVPGKATAVVHNAMATYCAVAREGLVFAVMDPPANQSATAIITYTKTTASLQGLTESASIYWPRVKIANPQASVYGTAEQIVVPPSGHIAGMFARTDSARIGGVYDPPAGTETGILYGVLGVEVKEVLDEGKRDLVFPERINPIRGNYVDGARCLKADGNWPTVGQIRGVAHIKRSLKKAMEVFRHKKRDEDLLGTERTTIDRFMLEQTGAGAFATRDPKLAYFVDMGKALNPASIPNTTKARIGVATAQPNEFVVLMFSQDTTALEASQK
jgi:uncharacterized protein